MSEKIPDKRGPLSLIRPLRVVSDPPTKNAEIYFGSSLNLYIEVDVNFLAEPAQPASSMQSSNC
jgi:hypothetical protein